MFAPLVARSQPRAAANSTAKLALHRSTLVAQFRDGAFDSAPVLQPRQVPLREGPGPSWDFSKIAIFPPSQQRSPTPLRLQAKLAIGAVNDPLEREADRVADQVMRMPAPELSLAAAPPQLSRKCAACEEEAQALQTKPAGSPEAAAGEAPPIVHEVLRSPGQPLDKAARASLEPRFGHDFSRVRIHADAKAAELARAVAAHAYTIGSDIVFGASRYAPGTESGRRLLAHELTHVVQQGFSRKDGALTVGPEGDAYEQQADAIASEVGAQSALLHPELAAPLGKRHGMDLEPRGILLGVIQRDAASPIEPLPDEVYMNAVAQGPQSDEGQNPDSGIEYTSQGPSNAGSDAGTDQTLVQLSPAPAATTPEITLETGNTGASPINNAVHQQICVDLTGGGGKQCYSFAATGAQWPQFSSTWLGWSSTVVGAILKGAIYDPDPVPGATVVSSAYPDSCSSPYLEQLYERHSAGPCRRLFGFAPQLQDVLPMGI